MVNLERELEEAERQLREVEATNKTLIACIEEETLLHKSIEAESSQESAQELNKYQCLLHGIETLHNLRFVGVDEIGNGEVALRVTVNDATVTLILNAKKQLVNIMDAPENAKVSEILEKCSHLPPPQDVRYALFYLTVYDKSAAIIREHCNAVCKKGLINFASSHQVDFSLPNGVSFTMTMDATYPFMPNAIMIDSMIGFGGWSADELDTLRSDINAMNLSTLPSIVEHVIKCLDDLERK